MLTCAPTPLIKGDGWWNIIIWPDLLQTQGSTHPHNIHCFVAIAIFYCFLPLLCVPERNPIWISFSTWNSANLIPLSLFFVSETTPSFWVGPWPLETETGYFRSLFGGSELVMCCLFYVLLAFQYLTEIHWLPTFQYSSNWTIWCAIWLLMWCCLLCFWWSRVLTEECGDPFGRYW